MNKYLEFNDGASNKFWQIASDGVSFTVRFGKSGTAGQEQIKTFSDAATAEKEALKLLNSKLKKGYAEAGTPLDEVKERLGSLFEAFFNAKDITPKNKMACLKAAETLYGALPPVLSDEQLESTALRVQKLLEKYIGKANDTDDADDESMGSVTDEEAGSAVKYYELDSKFWAITLYGNSFTVRFGKIGAVGQVQEKYFDDEETAAEEAEKLIKSKIRKGYAVAAIPASIAQAVSMPKSAAPPEAPKPKTRSLPAPVSDVKGGERKVADPDDYDEDGDARFNLDTLRSPEVVNVNPKTDIIPAKPKADTDVPAAGYDEAAFNTATDEMIKVLDHCRGANATDLIAALKRAHPTDKQLNTVYERAAKVIFSDDPWYVSLQALDMLPTIVDAGVNIAAIADHWNKTVDQYHQVKPLFKMIAQNIKNKSVDDIVTDFFRGVADIAVKQLEQVVAAIKAGTQEKINGGKLPNGETGFMIKADDPIAIYTAVGRNSLISQDYKPADDIKGSVIKRYLTPVIKPMLEKMMNEGVFDDIAAGGYIRIGLYSDPEPIVERRLDEALLAKRAAEMEAALTELEACDFSGDAALLDLTVRLYCEPNGIIVHKDTDRIIALLKRCLYSGEEAFEETARKLINQYDKLDYGTWRHVFISYTWDNFDYKWAKDAMARLAAEGYQNAKDTFRVWNAKEAAASGDEDDGDDDDTSGGIDYKAVYGYGDAAQAAEHRDKFTEAELFTETNTVIARAFADGYIHIRFKEESEQGYSDALDWLNTLMRAGYSKVHEGYELRVYFLAEPVFFEEMRDMIDEYQWPANDSHAFFCKAVRYPELRDKVADFARLTLNLNDSYLDLDGEFSTVAGTFAATAAAMADVKYMDVAIRYAVETDGEHEEMASLFSDVLEERWGVTPETAVAIALLKMSCDHDDPDLSDDFWKYPQNLDALTEYFSGTPIHYKEHKIIRLGNSLFEDAESGLAKLKKLFKDAADPQAKTAYADFHNMLLEALEQEEGGEYGKTIDYKTPVSKSEKKASTSTFKELPENPPCVITVAEVKKRGFTKDDFDPMEYKGGTPWWATIFAPLVITNPYIYDFFEENRAARQNLDHMCSTVFNATMVYTYKNKIALDLHGAPYQFGMMIYDKKEGTVLYGVYDYCKVVAKIGGKKIDRAKMEKLRDEFLFADCPQGAPIDDMSNPAIKLMDEARDAIFDDRYLRAVKKLERITPEAGEVYDASLIVLADVMTKKGDKLALKRVYETAAERMPQHKAYWDEKLKELP